MALPLQRLPERPFRTLPGGILRKFLRRLSQFPLSFLAKSRWVFCSSGELRFRARPPLPVSLQLTKNRKATGRLQACRLNASPHSVSCSGSYCSKDLKFFAPLQEYFEVNRFRLDNGECPYFSPCLRLRSYPSTRAKPEKQYRRKNSLSLFVLVV